MKLKYFTLVFLAAVAGITAPNAIAGNVEYIKACLANWGNHPFNARNPKFRAYSTKVRVFGLGGKISDTTPTSRPDLVLVSPNVSVMSKSTMELLNPNGWYCLRGKVNVLSSTTIKLHCKAHLASTSSGTTVLGGGNSAEMDHETTVLGGARVNLVGCDESESAQSNTANVYPGRSESVRQAQEKLAALGYSPGPADGLMGGRTTRAIQQFQRDNQLADDGTMNEQTQAALDSAVPQISAPAVAASVPAATAKPKDTSSVLVTRLRELNQLKQDGIISEEEFQALKQKAIEKY